MSQADLDRVREEKRAISEANYELNNQYYGKQLRNLQK